MCLPPPTGSPSVIAHLDDDDGPPLRPGSDLPLTTSVAFTEVVLDACVWAETSEQHVCIACCSVHRAAEVL